MKYVKYLLFAILIFIAIFFIKGLLTPSISYDYEITVDKPAMEAWAVMNDENKTKEWLKDITKIEHVSGEKGKAGAVTKYTYTDEKGVESYVVETLKMTDPFNEVAMDFVMEGVMKMDYKMELEESSGKTKIKSSTITSGEGILMKSLMSFMKKSMLAQEEENMENLKRVIDANTTDYLGSEIEVIEENPAQ
jgi:hypothetical protein